MPSPEQIRATVDADVDASTRNHEDDDGRPRGVRAYRGMAAATPMSA